MRKLWIVIGVVLIAIMGIVLITTHISREVEKVKIGVILPLTGDNAFYGESIKSAIDLAVEEINSSGGIKGKSLDIIYEDSQASPSQGVAVFNKLITIHKVRAVIGDAVSSVTLAISPIAEKNKIVVLSPLASAPEITTAGDFIFRNVPSDLIGGKVAAQFAAIEKQWRSFGLLFVNNDFGVGLTTVFSKTFTRLGGRIVAREAYEPGSTDFRTQLIKIKEAGPEVIFLVSYREAPQALIQARELGLTSEFLGTGLLEDPQVVEVAKTAAEGVFFTQLQYTPDLPDAVTKKFVQAFKARYGKEPNIIAAYGYDAMKILAFAMEGSDFTPIGIKDRLYEIRDFPGVTGTVSFDKNGDVVQPMGVKVVRNGEFTWYMRNILVEE